MPLLPGSYPLNDSTYLSRKDIENPKEYFKAVIEILKKSFGDRSFSIIDAGCAAGAFLYHAKKNLPITKSAGFDLSDKLIEQAKQLLPDTFLYVDSLTNPQCSSKNQYDACTCFGTLCIFDDIETSLKFLLSLVKKHGSLVIFDIFNECPVDVIMRYRLAQDYRLEDWKSGLNVRSKVTIEHLLKKIDSDIDINWIDFELPFPIEKQDDPMRAWTMQTENRKHQIVVGTGQMLDQKILHVVKKS